MKTQLYRGRIAGWNVFLRQADDMQVAGCGIHNTIGDFEPVKDLAFDLAEAFQSRLAVLR